MAMNWAREVASFCITALKIKDDWPGSGAYAY